MRHMAVEHPVSRIVRDELDISRLRNANERCIARHPRGLRNSAAFRPRGVKRMPVQVNRVVVHSKIDQTDANPIAEPDNQRRRRGSRFAIKHQPVEFHIHLFGTVLFGSTAYSCRRITKSLSTLGA